MAEVDGTAAVHLADDVVTIPVGDEALLHREADGTLLRLDPIGALVLALLDGTRTVATVVDELHDAFDDTPRAVIEQDVLALVARLDDDGLVAGGRP